MIGRLLCRLGLHDYGLLGGTGISAAMSSAGIRRHGMQEMCVRYCGHGRAL